MTANQPPNNMKKTIIVLLLALASSVQAWSQEKKEKQTALEKQYADVEEAPKKKALNEEEKTKEGTFITGRANRGVHPLHTNTFVIEYDFRTGLYDRNMLDLKANTPVVFKITNINRLAYDVSVSPRDSLLADTGWENGVQEFLKEVPLPSTAKANETESKAAAAGPAKILENNDIKVEVGKVRDTLVESLNKILHNSGYPLYCV